MPSFVKFIPTPSEDIDIFFEMAPLTSSDVVYDLGSGDGKLLFKALENGAGRVVGIELEPELVFKARQSAKSEGVEDRVTFIEGDITDINLSGATVVLCYLSYAATIVLKSKLESELKPGTRVVMESFPVPDWEPDNTWEYGYGRFYLYEMPPKITGKNE